MAEWQKQDDLPPLLKKWLKILERTEKYELQKHKRPRKGIIPFHIQHNTTLEVVRAVISDTRTSVSVTPATWGKIKPFLCQMGLLTTKETLSHWGEQLKGLLAHEPTLLGDAVHGYLYTLHRFKPQVRFSFAYSVICDWLWERREVVVDSRVVSELVGIVVERGSEVYGIPPEEIAFSPNSVRGAFNWLKSLEPPVFERVPNRKVWVFRRRQKCSPLVVLWALSAWWQLQKASVGEWLTWNSDLEEFLSRCLLLDEGYAKIAVEVAAGWQTWRDKILEAQTRGHMLSAIRLNRVLGWGEFDLQSEFAKSKS